MLLFQIHPKSPKNAVPWRPVVFWDDIKHKQIFTGKSFTTYTYIQFCFSRVSLNLDSLIWEVNTIMFLWKKKKKKTISERKTLHLQTWIWFIKIYEFYLLRLLFVYKLKWVLISLGGGVVTKSCLTLAIPCSVAFQAPPSMGFSRQEYWSGFSFSIISLIL